MSEEKNKQTEENRTAPKRQQRTPVQAMLASIDMKGFGQRLEAEIESSGLLDTLDRPDAPQRASKIIWSALKVDGPVLVDALKEALKETHDVI